MNVLLTGTSGQLGSAILREFGRDCRVIALSHRELDITRHRDVMERVRACRPDVIINCAGYNDVDGAQEDATTALAVNGFAVRSLAMAAAEVDAVFVHYSSDFVFDGRTDRPYTEEDAPNPRSFYAMSKLLGEWFTREAPRWYLLRVESLFGGCAFGSTHKSSVDRIADAVLDGREAVVFSDRTVSPSFVVDVSIATRRLLEMRAPYGLYHCVNSEHCTWLELAGEMASHLASEARLVPKRMSDVPLCAERPQYCALSNAKLAATGIPMPSWQDALARYLDLRTSEARLKPTRHRG